MSRTTLQARASSVALALAALLSVGCASAPAVVDAPPVDTTQVPATAEIRTVTLPSAQSPLVAIRLVFEVGSVDDPAGREGLAALTAAMMAKGGGGERSYAEVLDALYPMAASVNAYTTRETMVLEGTVHRDNLTAYTDILLDQVLRPRLAAEDFTRNRQAALDYLGKDLVSQDDEELGKHAMTWAMYPAGHPYHHAARGTVAGVTATTLEDVRAFHGRMLSRDALVLGVAGGYPDGFVEQLKARLGALPARRPARPALPQVAVGQGVDTVVIEKETRSVAISIGRPLTITRADDDFYPLLVAASYLGEHRTFNGVLMQNMRGKRGLNYGDYAYIESFIQEGWSTFPRPNIQRRQQHFEIWIRPVAPHNAGFALRQALYETDKLIREGITEQGFEDTRSFLLSYRRLWVQDASRRLGYAIDGELVGRELVEELGRRLPTMTREDVNRAIRKHLSTEGLTVALVAADAKALAEKLIEDSPTPIVYDTEGTPGEVLAEDDVIERFPLGITRARTRVVPAAETVAR